MARVFFEDGEIIEGRQNAGRRLVRAKQANYGPMRYWFRAPVGYWSEFALYQKEPEERAKVRNTK